MSIKYGSSRHYIEGMGEKYFEYQNRMGALSGRLNAWKFMPYVKSDDSILDFGCGGGWLVNQLSGARKCGVELNSVARDCCREIGVESYESIPDIPAGLSFDVIITNHALEHVPYPIEALRELRSRLKPGGKLIIVIPIDDWRTQSDYSGADMDHHLHTWTPRLFANTLVEAGFVPLRIDILTDAWPPAVAQFYRLPKPVFRAISWVWSILRKRRQLRAVAVHSDDIPRAG